MLLTAADECYRLHCIVYLTLKYHDDAEWQGSTIHITSVACIANTTYAEGVTPVKTCHQLSYTQPAKDSLLFCAVPDNIGPVCSYR